ncbi:MAG TPA: alpha/beta fold hydrolase [Gemmatimonadales bacterium]|nr:alpha/beta fold hydrolase [Gemmatimonadales bacterium]
MATPTLKRHRLPGVLGELLIDVRTAGGSSPRPAVIVVPGFKGFKDWGMFPPLCERLARAGFAAVSVNLSGSGVDDSGNFAWPDRFGHNTLSAELTDLATVVDAISAGSLGFASPPALGIVGHSRGGGIAILLTERDARVKALVTWAAISTVDRWPGQQREWRARGYLDILNSRTGQVLPLFTDVLDDVERNRSGTLDIPGAAARLTTPWLVVHGAADASVPPEEGERLAAAGPSGHRRFLLIPDGDHTLGIRHPYQGSTPQFERAQDETLAWLNGALG